MALKMCTNKACGKQYKDEDNYDGACHFHPGHPIFHEGLKGWSCCSKRFTDFTEWLNSPGCTTGLHTDVKPPEPEKAEKDAPLGEGEVLEVTAPECRAPVDMAPRIQSSDELVPLSIKVSSSLKKALARQAEKQAVTESADEAAVELKPGHRCTNNACKGEYKDASSHEETCIHHPGTPVFHEGMKYWSCCDKKKTHDFEEFLARPGCTEGKHRWFKKKEETAQTQQCRYDWFQTGNTVVVSIFAKCVDPDTSSVKASKDSLSVFLRFEGNKQFALDLHLSGDIDLGSSSAEFLGTKAEITLQKAGAASWPSLAHETPKE